MTKLRDMQPEDCAERALRVVADLEPFNSIREADDQS